MVTTPEARTKTAIRKYLTSQGIFWSNVSGGAYSKSGDMDIIACVHGRCLGIEGKSPTGSPTELQLERRRQLLASGGYHVIGKNLEDIIRKIEEIEDEIGWKGRGSG